MLGYIVDALENRDDLAFSDYKTMLQEIIQKIRRRGFPMCL